MSYFLIFVLYKDYLPPLETYCCRRRCEQNHYTGDRNAEKTVGPSEHCTVFVRSTIGAGGAQGLRIPSRHRAMSRRYRGRYTQKCVREHANACSDMQDSLSSNESDTSHAQSATGTLRASGHQAGEFFARKRRPHKIVRLR